MAPMNAAAIIILARMATWKEIDPWLRHIAWATLAQQCVGLFYAPAGRYYYLTWLLTALVTVVWLHREGLGLFQRRYRSSAPDLQAALPITRSPACCCGWCRRNTHATPDLRKDNAVMILRRRVLLLAGTAAATLLVTQLAGAQGYPVRPVRIIVPFAPGGPTDVFARLMAQKLSEQVGTQFYVENFGGAGGNIGAVRAAQSAPDGYTLLVNGANLVVNPDLYAQVHYDPIRDFDCVTHPVTSAAILTVHPSVPVSTVKDLVELIRAHPGTYSYASPGAGTPPHLVGELFRLSLGLDLLHVPFNGGGQAIASVLAGHTPVSFGSMAPAVPLVKDGKLRALAVSTENALPGAPRYSHHDRSGVSRNRR